MLSLRNRKSNGGGWFQLIIAGVWDQIRCYRASDVGTSPQLASRLKAEGKSNHGIDHLVLIVCASIWICAHRCASSVSDPVYQRPEALYFCAANLRNGFSHASRLKAMLVKNGDMEA